MNKVLAPIDIITPVTVPVDFTIKVGRPTNYHDGIPDECLHLGSKGLTLAQMCAYWNIGRPTLNGWAKDHPEFQKALSIANSYRQAFWEYYAMTKLGDNTFNAYDWHKKMQAWFRDDYTERRVTEVTGDGGGPVLVAEHKRIDISLLSDDDLEQLERLLIAADSQASE